MSICSISQSKYVANASRTRTVGNLATGAKVSWKSIPSLCSKPLNTSLDLYQREPSGFVLILNTHLVLRAFLPGGNLAGFHVPFSLWDLYSSAIDSRHFWGSSRASLKVTGSSVFPIRVAKALISGNSWAFFQILVDLLGSVTWRLLESVDSSASSSLLLFRATTSGSSIVAFSGTSGWGLWAVGIPVVKHPIGPSSIAVGRLS